jgi:hypothetical protein
MARETKYPGPDESKPYRILLSRPGQGRKVLSVHHSLEQGREEYLSLLRNQYENLEANKGTRFRLWLSRPRQETPEEPDANDRLAWFHYIDTEVKL